MMRIFFSIIIIILLLLSVGVVRKLDSLGFAREKARLECLPSGQVLKVISLGYQILIGDMIWIQAVQYLGRKDKWPRDDLTFFNLLDRATILDPNYKFIYHAGGICLSKYGGQYKLSNRFLSRGLESLGERLGEDRFDWWIPFLIGFNHFFHLGDFRKGANYMMIAARLPGSPRYLPALATTLLARAGDPRAAIAFLQNMRDEASDEVTRSYLEETLEKKKKELLEGGVDASTD